MRKIIISLLMVAVMMVIPVYAGPLDLLGSGFSLLMQQSSVTTNMTWYLGGKNQIRDFIMPLGAKLDLYEKVGSDGTMIFNVGYSAQWPKGNATIHGPILMGNLKRAIAKLPKLDALNDAVNEIGISAGYSAGNENKDKRFTISLTVVLK